MWHEQRKEEKRIKGMMVDRRKRAERRRDHYDKIKADPNQFLQMHGRQLKVNFDPNLALAAESPANMMPWNGDKQILIDRFDVRANLDYIPEYKPSKDKVEEKLDYKEEKELRLLNYERFRILVQNEYLGVQEEKFLRMIDLEEKYGGTTYQNQKAKEDKKKAGTNKVAIGFVYDTPAAPEPAPEPESDSDSDTDSEIDFDLNVDVMALGTEEQDQINQLGVGYELGSRDFVKMLAKDVEETEEYRLQKQKESEKSNLSGKKSRRERKMLKDERLKERGMLDEAPSYAQKTEEDTRERSRSESESDSEESGEDEKVEFITSFGGADSDTENKNGGFTFRKRKEYKEPIGPSLPGSATKKKSEKSSRRKRSRSRDRGSDKSSRKSKSSKKRSRRSRSRSRKRSRSRQKRKSRSRSGSKSSGRSSLNSRPGSPEEIIHNIAEQQRKIVSDVVPDPEYKAASNHHPSMLAYPPPPKPDYLTSIHLAGENAVPRPRMDPVPPGFVPPLPKMPHPDELKQGANAEKKKDKNGDNTSDSSDEDKETSKTGYRSKYRKKAAASSDEEEKQANSSIYSSSMSKFFSAVSEQVKEIDGNSQPAPPPVKRYYGRRKEKDSDSELSGLDSDSEHKRIAEKIKQRVEKSKKASSASKMSEIERHREKIRKKMQQQIKKTYKEDKKAEQEKMKKLEEEQYYREEELRELGDKIRAKEREKRLAERSRSRSRDRSRDRRRSRSRDRRRRSRSRDRGSSRRSSRRSRSGSRGNKGLVDY